VFYDMPEIVIRLDGGQGSYLKLATVLDLAAEHTPDEMKAIEPRLLDVMQTYLIELKPEDIRGTAGMYRVRQELLRRVNDLAPGSTKDILFKTIILQ
jgi:flagellar FliL protein